MKLGTFQRARRDQAKAEEYQATDKKPRGMHNEGDWYADQQANPYSGSHWQDQYRPDDPRM